MKTSEWKNLTEEELLQRRQELLKEMLNLRLQRSTGQLEKPSRIRDLRRDVARANTYLRQRITQTKEPVR